MDILMRLLPPIIVIGAFVSLCWFAARDPKNRRGNPDGYDDADEWRL